MEEVTKVYGYTAFEENPDAIAAAFDRTEQKFTRQLPSPITAAAASTKPPPDAEDDEEGEHEEEPIPPETPSWKREQIEREREDEKRKRREGKSRRKVHQMQRKLHRLCRSTEITFVLVFGRRNASESSSQKL